MQITGNDELRRYLLDRNDILVSTNLSNEEEHLTMKQANLL